MTRLGQSHQATITYDKTATNLWSYLIALPPGEATGSLSFDTSGNLIPPMTASWHFSMPVSVGDTVANVQGLASVGGNNFRTTASSGQAIAGVAGTGGRGVYGSTLEQSNVNIATEFSNLIIAQRAFEENSKTVTTIAMVL